MKNHIDLNKYNIRTDLIIENIDHKTQEEKIEKEIQENIMITTIKVDNNLSSSINRKPGTYITIEFDDITNYEDREKVGECLEQELKKIINISKVKENDECLIIGLGNRKSTPDSLGPKVIDKVMVTRHLFELGTNVKEGIRKVSALSPGVMADTGIETYDIITSLIEKIKPKFLIVIDALASSSIDRINKTIQITDTGINPGSGVGNHRKEISKDTLNIPVIAIGIPTVVDSATIVSDTITYLFKHLSYIKNNYYENKLIFTRNNKYIEKLKNSDLSEEEKKELSGIIGSLSEEEKKNLINEVLTSINYNLIVTPKEIDFLIDKLSEVLAGSLNNSLHRSVNNY